MASTFGTGLGGLVHVGAGALGVSAIVLASAELFTGLKLIGAIYLMFPQFVDLTQGHVALQFMALGSISVALNTLADVMVTFAASRIRASATARPGLIRRLREVSGGAMIALGVGLALTKRPAS